MAMATAMVMEVKDMAKAMAISMIKRNVVYSKP
jgi:hypothetical protein